MSRRVFALIVALMAVACHDAVAQKYPERRIVRSGNRDFKEGNYVDSEVKYRQALEMVPGMYEGLFNLGDALYKEERFADAASMWQQVAADSTRTKVERAEALYNIGNSLFREQKLQEALEKYKESLRLNPFDRDAKFNLALTKKLLEQNKDNDQNRDNQNDGNNQDNQNDDRNQDDNDRDQNRDNQDQNKDNQDKQDNKDDPDNPDKDKNDKQNDGGNDPDKDPNKDPDKNDDKNPDGKDNPDKPQPQSSQPQGMSRDEAERMLQAVQNEEDKTRDKVDKKKAAAAAVAKSGKNW